jgi:hypothetical protein
MLPGVYLTVTGVPTLEQREVAALLYGGPRSVMTGPAALRRHLLRVPEPEIIDVLIPAGQHRQSQPFVRVRRTHQMPDLCCTEGVLRWVLVARAVADTARGLPDLAGVRAVVAEAVQRERCSVALLGSELASGPVRGSALLRQVLAEVAEGVRSSAEGDLRDLITRARLPMPLFNPRLYVGDRLIAVPDCWWPRAGVAVEVDSREWHFAPEQWERTMRRHESMGAHGIITVHLTPRRIRREPGSVATAIRDALAAGSGRPPLAIRTVSAATAVPLGKAAAR